jgi:hypothetical protein
MLAINKNPKANDPLEKVKDEEDGMKQRQFKKHPALPRPGALRIDVEFLPFFFVLF